MPLPQKRKGKLGPELSEKDQKKKNDHKSGDSKKRGRAPGGVEGTGRSGRQPNGRKTLRNKDGEMGQNRGEKKGEKTYLQKTTTPKKSS